MSNKERFFACCKTLAYIDGCIDSLQTVGLIVEPSGNDHSKTFANLLYGACDDLIATAMSYLDIKDFHESERVYQEIMTAKCNDYITIATEAWELYGVE